MAKDIIQINPEDGEKKDSLVFTLAHSTLEIFVSTFEAELMKSEAALQSALTKFPSVRSMPELPYSSKSGKKLICSELSNRFQQKLCASKKKVEEFKCLFSPKCNKTCERRFMRQHVAGHLLKKTAVIEENTCGFCGRKGTCTLTLKISSKTKNAVPNSNCPSYIPLKLKSASSFSHSRNATANHCTNIPVVCPACEKGGRKDQLFWKYNLPKHYSIHHESIQVPDDLLICKEEKLWFQRNKV